MTDVELQKDIGFSYGLKAIDKAKAQGKEVTETEDGFIWEGGFVKKSFLKAEENLTNELYKKTAERLMFEVFGLKI